MVDRNLAHFVGIKVNLRTTVSTMSRFAIPGLLVVFVMSRLGRVAWCNASIALTVLLRVMNGLCMCFVIRIVVLSVSHAWIGLEWGLVSLAWAV
jgi:hypothetical protein